MPKSRLSSGPISRTTDKSMKKSVISLICLLSLSFNLHGGDFVFLPITAIDGSWMSERIPVNSSDGTVDVMTLLKAFHATWPTEVVQKLIDEAGDRRYVPIDETESDEVTGHLYVDCDDFNYASYDNGEQGSQRVDAMAYQCENGHTLFGICFEEYGNDPFTFCCFFNYDPDTRLMTPEKTPYAELKRKWEDSQIRYYLGMYYDLTVIVQETSPEGEVWNHHFYFDGMKHVYHHSGEDFYLDEEEELDDY